MPRALLFVPFLLALRERAGGEELVCSDTPHVVC